MSQVQGDEQVLGTRAHTQMRLSARRSGGRSAGSCSVKVVPGCLILSMAKSSRVLPAESIPVQEKLQHLRRGQAVTIPTDKLVNRGQDKLKR